jgi:hypothetical protein
MAARRMRAGHTQSLLASVRRLPSGERASILEATGAAIAEIDDAIALPWLPMTIHRLSDALRDVVGSERNRRIWRATMDESGGRRGHRRRRRRHSRRGPYRVKWERRTMRME